MYLTRPTARREKGRRTGGIRGSGFSVAGNLQQLTTNNLPLSMHFISEEISGFPVPWHH